MQSSEESQPVSGYSREVLTRPLQGMGTATETLLFCPFPGCRFDLLMRHGRCVGNVQQLNNMGEFSGKAQKGIMSAPKFCKVPEILLSFFFERSILMAS